MNRFISAAFGIFIPTLAAAAPAVDLNVTFSSSQRTSQVVLTPSESAAGCTYALHGSGKRSRLVGTLSDATLLTSLTGASGPTTVLADELKFIRRPQGAQRDKAKLYFVAELNCAGTLARSNIDSVLVPYRKRGGLRNPARWFRNLEGRLTTTELSLRVAFANLSFTSPIDLQNAGDGTNRLFLVEQGGRIWVFNNDPATSTKTLFINLSSKVVSGGERGLLGVAFHPQYESNRYFYANYTRSGDGATVIARYTANSGDPNQADIGSEFIILTIAQPYANHNGGQLAFGPDGYLYIGMGDGGSGGDPLGHGQNRQTMLGDFLRIDVDHTSSGKNYAIPSDNPYVGNTQGFAEEIYAYGVRNPWRFSFDPETSRLWAGEVGQGSREEIDIITKGANYGWNTMEGTRCYNPSSGCNQSGLTLPVYDYSHSLGASITGGYVYRGTANPGLIGSYIYSDFISGSIWALQYDGTTVRNLDLFSTELNVSSFGIDEDRELYFLSYAEGKIYTFVTE